MLQVEKAYAHLDLHSWHVRSLHIIMHVVNFKTENMSHAMHGVCAACAGRRAFGLGLLQWVSYLPMCCSLIFGAGLMLVLSPNGDILHVFINRCVIIILIFQFLGKTTCYQDHG